MLLIFAAILFFVIPGAFYSGEHIFCEGEHTPPSKLAVHQQEAGAVAFDTCNLVDFGMFPWMLYSFVGGLVTLFAAAFSYSVGKRARS
jgi:hypothetical protein